MVKVAFTSNLEKHLDVPTLEVDGATIGEVLEACCEKNPSLRSYILDDQGSIRKHVAVFVDGNFVEDKISLGDAVKPDSEVFVMQALSGG